MICFGFLFPTVGAIIYGTLVFVNFSAQDATAIMMLATLYALSI